MSYKLQNFACMLKFQDISNEKAFLEVNNKIESSSSLVKSLVSDEIERPVSTGLFIRFLKTVLIPSVSETPILRLKVQLRSQSGTVFQRQRSRSVMLERWFLLGKTRILLEGRAFTG